MTTAYLLTCLPLWHSFVSECLDVLVVYTLFFKFIFLLNMSACLCVCVSVHVYVGAQEGNKGVVDALELDLLDDYKLFLLSAGR